MAEGEGKVAGVPILVWVLLALVVGYFLLQKAAKATGTIGKETGYGIGKGATETLLSSEGASALGKFIGGLFGGSSGKGSASFTGDDELGEFDGPGGYDTSSFRVYED